MKIKPEWVKNCFRVAEQNYDRMDEICQILDRYRYLEEATRGKRKGGQDAVYYMITDSTKISRVLMRKLPSQAKT